jgi:RNA polymerase sigma-70 factor (TIGR02943 family)
MDPFCLQLTKMHSALLRTAHGRLRNSDWAEDAVSETLLAALQKRPNFVEPGRLRAWLFGILRHKVVDQLRQHLGEDGKVCSADNEDENPHELGDCSRRADPMHRLVDQQFIAALHGQLNSMPQVHARAFVMRECLGQDTKEICKELAVSANNLAVIVHRTRQRLRQSLADHHV